MMPWELLVVPVIAVAVWIIGTLIRSAEQAKGPEGAPRRQPEQVTDLDRFLREVNRRRQARQPRDEEEPTARVERREPPRRPAPPPPPPEVIPVVLPVAEVVVAQPAPAAPTLRVHEAPALPELPADKSARPLPERPESAALASLRKLLRSRDGLRTAVVLQEVLGPPLSRRRGP
jgi:hypothetical protein